MVHLINNLVDAETKKNWKEPLISMFDEIEEDEYYWFNYDNSNNNYYIIIIYIIFYSHNYNVNIFMHKIPSTRSASTNP